MTRGALARLAAATVAGLLAGLLVLWWTRDPVPVASTRQQAAAALAPEPRDKQPTRQTAATRPRTRVAVHRAALRRQPAAQALAPTRVRLGRLGIDMRVLRVGVAKGGWMALPGSPGQAGWYRFGSAPADRSGAVVVAAHVDAIASGNGPFAALPAARRGDRVLVETRNRTFRYTVVRTVRVRKDVLDPRDLFARTGPRRLHLVTCGGPFDPDTGYRDNVVVVARAARG